MSVQQQIEHFVHKTIQEIKANLSPNKKNIAIIAYYPTYRKHFGGLIEKLKAHYHVLTIVDRLLDDEFERAGHVNILFPWRIVEGGETYYLQADIEGIDLILTADQVGYEEGRIDREFLSKRAKRIYFPHSLIEATGDLSCCDYVCSPTTITTQAYQSQAKGAKILNTGYPKFDTALKNYTYTPQNTITYAPALRYVNGYNNAELNVFVGHENHLIEWLLHNTSYHVLYRAHPLNFTNGHGFYELIKQNWSNEPRVSFDQKLGSEFYHISDFCLSDYSTTAYTYSLTSLHPSFFYKPLHFQTPLEQYMPKLCGGGAYARNFAELKEQIFGCDYSKMRSIIKDFRDEIVFCLGHSESYILECIEEIIKGKL